MSILKPAKISKERKYLIKYIDRSITCLTLSDRVIVASMLQTCSIKIWQQGHGCSISYDIIPDDLLLSIKIFVENAKVKNEIKW